MSRTEIAITNNITGGILNDAWTNKAGVYDCQNVVVNSNSQYTTLNSEFGDQTGYSSITALDYFSSWSTKQIYSIAGDGSMLYSIGANIYRNDTNALVITIESAVAYIKSIGTGVGNVVVTTNGNIYYLDGWITSPTATKIATSAITASQNGKIYSIQYWGWILLCWWYYIVEITSAGALWTTSMTLPQEISWISKLWDYYYIFGRNQQYIWSWVWTSPDQTIAWWERDKILWCVSINSSVYVVCAGLWSSSLYEVQWSARRLVYKWLIDDADKVFSTVPNGRMTYCITEDDWWILFWGNFGAYIFKQNNADLSWSLTKLNVPFREIDRMIWRTILGRSKYTDKIAVKYIASPDQYITSQHGFIKGKPITWELVQDVKSPVRLIVWYENTANTFLSVMYKYENNVDNKRSFFTKDTITAVVGDTYTLTTPDAWSTTTTSTYRIDKITTKSGFTILETTSIAGTKTPNALKHLVTWFQTNAYYLGMQKTVLTRATGSGNATITFYDWTDHIFLKWLDTTGINKETIVRSDTYRDFHKMQWYIGLYSTNTADTPKFYDSAFIYNVIDDDRQ